MEMNAPLDYPLIKAEMDLRLQKVRRDISDALSLSGRKEESLTLIGVSKFFPPEYAQAAFELGLTDLGENRVQEMLSKQDTLERLGLYPDWHLIGTLQTNKVKMIIGHTKLIHSVSSEELLNEISKRSTSMNVITSVLLQVNVSGEETKHGFESDQMDRIMDLAGNCTNIKLCGLMTMAPIQLGEHDARPIFDKTNELFMRLKTRTKEPDNWTVLSMGMSQDYIDAIQCGATHIRIGTAIFGQRLY